MKLIVNLGKKNNNILKYKDTVQNEIEKTKSNNHGTDDTQWLFYELDDAASSNYAAVPLAPRKFREELPIQRIQKMRQLKVSTEGLVRGYFYKDTALFLLQAKYMDDFEDDYHKTVSYTTYCPTYNDLNTEQLRCYFSWRTKVRRGIVELTSLSNVYLYVYEIINNVGVIDADEGLEKLVFIWQQYRKYDKGLDRYLIDWLKDYYVCNDFKVSFSSLVLMHKLE